LTSADLNHELQSRGVSLLLARDVGQFRDVVEHTPGDADLVFGYATIADAVTAGTRLDRS
jgi:hypothetical protein